jgi:hypothetical protein
LLDEYEQGSAGGRDGYPDVPDPVQDCRRPRRDASFNNGLIAWPAQTGEDRISPASWIATRSGYGSNLDTPCLLGFGRLVREGRLFNVVVPDVSRDRVS